MFITKSLVATSIMHLHIFGSSFLHHRESIILIIHYFFNLHVTCWFNMLVTVTL